MPNNAFTKPGLKQIQDDIVRIIGNHLSPHGIQVRFRGGKFNPTLATLKLELFIPQVSGETAEEANFKRHAGLYGLHPTDLRRTFRMNGHVYVLTGMRSGRSKYKFTCQRCSDNKPFVVTRDSLRFVGDEAQTPSTTVSGRDTQTISTRDVGSLVAAGILSGMPNNPPTNNR